MDIEKLIKTINEVKSKYYKLLLLLSSFAETNTNYLQAASNKLSCPYINLSLALAGQLMDIPAHRRSSQIINLLPNLVRGYSEEVLFFDHIELLFQADLGIDPLRALQQLSRNKIIVAAWTGEFDGKKLTYASPDHPEYKRYQGLSEEECAILQV